MKNKIKNIFKILVVTAGCFVFASFSPSLDGRAVVVDNGVFPQGLFAKTVGYLPGDIISVTNIAGDRTIDLLVIGALDPSEGVAIMLSPEAADAMGIEKGSNNIVKITKRSGQDERVYGNAVISKSAADLDDFDDNFETIGAEENTEAFDDTAVAETPAELEEPEAEDEFEEEALDEDFEDEEALDEELEEAEAEDEAEEFEEPEEEADFEEEELDEEYEEEELDEELEEAFDEAVDEELDEELDEESEFDEEPLDEDIEEKEDLAEEYSEEDPEELEEAPEEEAFEDEELSELPADEEVEEEFDEEAEVEAEEPEEEEAEIEAEEAFEDEAVEEEAFEEDEVPASEEFDEEAAEEAFEADELDSLPEEVDEEVTEESDVETDEYEAIVLVPVDSNPPESESDEVEDVISEDDLDAIEEVEEITESTPVPDTPAASVTETRKNATSYDKYMVPSLKDLESGKYYIQIAVYAADENILEVINKYGNNYPITIVPMAGGNAKQILIGPVTMDEYKVVLERFKSYGFKDAFLRKVR